MWYKSVPTTMQEFGDYCKNMVQDNGGNGNSISITLRDTRDNNTYTVAKLKDGKCWMTQNLRIVGKTISSSDSDMTSGTFNIPASTNGQWCYNSNDCLRAHFENSTIGSYYPWYVAAAGTIGSTTTKSICPKQWTLPTRSDFNNLIQRYGTTSSPYFSTPFNANHNQYALYGGYPLYQISENVFPASEYPCYLRIQESGNIYVDTPGWAGHAVTVRCVSKI